MLKFTEDHEWLRADGDEIVVVDPANDAAHPPPAKKLKLDKPKEAFSPVEIVEIL